MTEFQAHDMLARALGDPFAPNANPAIIPDGVRYSAVTRANYIDRARKAILEQAIKGILQPAQPGTTSPPTSYQSATIGAIFPRLFRYLTSSAVVSNMTDLTYSIRGYNEYRSFATLNQSNVYCIHTVYSEEQYGGYQIPLVESSMALRLINELNPQRPDPIAWIDDGTAGTDLTLRVHWGQREPATYVWITYTRYPNALTGVGTTIVDWEPMHDHAMISRATIYGQYDSQEFGVPEQILPILLQ